MSGLSEYRWFCCKQGRRLRGGGEHDLRARDVSSLALVESSRLVKATVLTPRTRLHSPLNPEPKTLGSKPLSL